MAIIANLEELMRKKGYTIVKLAEEVGISTVNLSKIKNGNISAIRFSTLEKICNALDCQPGDILKYEHKKKVIPLFLDYSGTTDLILKGGARDVRKFFDSIKILQQKTGYEIRAIMVTGSSKESAKSKYRSLSYLAENEGLPHFFDGAVAEYCGYVIRKDRVQVLKPLDSRILEKRNEIEEIIKEFNGEINPDVKSIYDIQFEDITRENMAKVAERIESLLNDNELETVTYYDEYGKECDVKPKNQAKWNAVRMIVNDWKEKFDMPFVIIGGDSQEEDYMMYTKNKERFEKIGLRTLFIAPSNFGKIAEFDRNIILSDWENSNGIADAIEQLTERIEVKDDGGLEI